ncbi:NAD(P)-binding protein [Schizophyllum commune Loenen D]|nr:NAD(P)-binding protein [Schizophyllum commune Loenen D]
MDLGLKDVHVLITGASGGIGLATTKEYLAQGAKVTAHYNSNNTSLAPLLSAHTDTLTTVQADVTREPAVARLFADAAARFGPVQVVVVNHGISPEPGVPVVDMALERWRRTLTVNLDAVFLVTREYLRGLRAAGEEAKEKAAVVLVGSTAGQFGLAGQADYASAKSAMMYGLTLSLKNEIVKIAPLGRVNAVAPGWVWTPMAEAQLGQEPERMYRALATMPLKKIAVAEDIATQIVLLSSAKASGHVSGQVVTIAGGMEGRLLNHPDELAQVRAGWSLLSEQGYNV